MPAQPLSSIRRNAEVIVGPNCINKYPKLAGLVAYAIGFWSHVEALHATVLTIMLDAKARPAVAMYSALVSAAAQAAAAQAAAKETLPADRLALFNAVNDIMVPLLKRRNEFAHNLWGITPKIVNALLLIDRSALLSHQLDRLEFARNNPIISTLPEHDDSAEVRLPQIDKSKIYVYEERHLDEVIQQMGRIYFYLIEMTYIVSPMNPLSDHALARLSAEPEIRTMLCRRQSNPQPPA